MRYYLLFSDYLAYGKCLVSMSAILLRNDSDKSESNLQRKHKFSTQIKISNRYFEYNWVVIWNIWVESGTNEYSAYLYKWWDGGQKLPVSGLLGILHW